MDKKSHFVVVLAVVVVFLLYTALSFVKINIRDPLSALGIMSPSAKNAELLSKNLDTRLVKINGTVEVLLAENLKEHKSWNEYYIKDKGGGSKRLIFSEEKQIDLKNGSTIVAAGIEAKDGFIVNPEDIQVTENTSAARQGNTLPNDKGVKKIKVAVILFNFTDNPVQTFSAGYTKDIIFGNIAGVSTNDYYAKVSKGKLSLVGKIDTSGDVYGWYTIPVAQSAGCNPVGWSGLADQIATADGFDSSGYDMVIYNFPNPTNCPWTGLANMEPVPSTPVYTPRKAWLQGTWTPTYVHEVGHLLGLQHANAVECSSAGQRVPISEDCVSVQNGDPFDAMGGHDGLYINSRNQDYLGFMPSGDVKVVRNTGIYTISALDSTGQGPRSIKIPIGDDLGGTQSLYYYLDFRNGTGWDSVIDTNARTGISIRIGANDHTPEYFSGNNSQDFNSRSYIIDTHPGTPSFIDAPLQLNEVFYDTSRGIRITHIPQLGQGTNTKSVKIEFLNGMVGCHIERPTLILEPQSLTVQSGDPTTLKYTLTNNDSGGNCAPRIFEISLVNFNLHMLPPPLMPGETHTEVVTFNIPTSAASQSTQVALFLSDKNGVLIDGFGFNVSNYITINIQNPFQCQLNTPSIQFTYDGVYDIPGFGPSFRYIKTITNNNTNCTFSRYITILQSINGWRYFAGQNCSSEINPWVTQTDVLPQSLVSTYECLIPPANIMPGRYDFPFFVSDNTASVNWGQLGVLSQVISGDAVNTFDN